MRPAEVKDLLVGNDLALAGALRESDYVSAAILKSKTRYSRRAGGDISLGDFVGRLPDPRGVQSRKSLFSRLGVR